MAIVNQPTPLSNELAWNGDKNPIPDTNDGSKGLFSIEYGFPYVTQQLLAQGGIPPQRNDFNGVLNLLSKFIRYFQNGGVFAYSANMDYSVGMIVRSGDRLYVCKAENGANTSAGVQNISNSNYWNEITLEDTLSDTLVNQLKTVLVTEAKTAANTADWNTLTESRTYKISGATFSADKHQPVGAVGTGELIVLKNGDDTIAQVYYANSAAYDKAGAYHRINIGGTWTDWVYNITNKGGSVAGNFDINGKLTVDTIEVSNSLTIGGAPPLGQDAIDKIQAQIIAPSQTIYVDCQNGNDENDGSTYNKRVRTLDKAVSLIRTSIPYVSLVLSAYADDRLNTYTISRPILGGTEDMENNTAKDLTKIRIETRWDDWLNNGNKIAKIIVPFGQVARRVLSSNVEYRYGNCLFVNIPKIYLLRINIDLSDTKLNDDNLVANCVAFGYSTFEADTSTINLSSTARILTIYSQVIESFKLNNTNVNGNGLLTSCIHPAWFPANWNGIDGTEGAEATIPNGINSVINTVLFNSSKIDSQISSKDNKGFTNNIHLIYSNY